MPLSTARPFLISPPFGTYLHHARAYSVRGSFTRHPRPGRLGQVLRTVRPVPGGWINKIGLRNPGVLTVRDCAADEILSLAPIDGNEEEWEFFVRYLKSQTAVLRSVRAELNVSCPNTDHPVPALPSPRQMRELADLGSWTPKSAVIFKLQPLPSSIEAAQRLAEMGARYIHLSNTYPSPVGGISGDALREVNLPLVDRVASLLAREHSNVDIIAGGGIKAQEHVEAYRRAGAVRFSLATAWAWPPRALAVLRQRTAIENFEAAIE